MHMTKTMWTPLQIRGCGYFSHTHFADRCIKLSTPPCNLHRQTLAAEWPVLKSSVTFNVAPSYDATFPTCQFVKCQRCYSCPSTVSVVIVKWKRIGETTVYIYTYVVEFFYSLLLKTLRPACRLLPNPGQERHTIEDVQ